TAAGAFSNADKLSLPVMGSGKVAVSREDALRCFDESSIGDRLSSTAPSQALARESLFVAVQASEVLIIGRHPGFDFRRPIFDVGEQLLSLRQLLRVMSQQRQRGLRVPPEPGQDAVIAPVRPVVLK